MIRSRRTRRRTRLPFIALGALAGLAAVVAHGYRAERPANVVLIVVDTMRADALSSSAGAAATPAFDSLAAEGIAFRQAFAHAPLTVPSHASIFSGRLPHEAGVTANGVVVPPDLPLLAEHLRSEGYTTAAAVSLATLWPSEPLRGFDRGFDHYDTGERMIERSAEVLPRIRAALDAAQADDGPFFLFAHVSDPHEPYCSYEGPERRAHVELSGEELGAFATSHAEDWRGRASFPPGTSHLRVRSDEEFKLRALEVTDGRGDLSHSITRGATMQAGREIVVQVENPRIVPVFADLRVWANDVPSLEEVRARYRAEVEAADRAVGELLTELRARDLYHDALIVLTSDHGEGLGEHGIVGHAVQLYDEALHVPLVMKLPRGERPEHLSRAVGTIVRQKDLAPTILAELGLARQRGTTGRPIGNAEPRLLHAEAYPPAAPQHVLAMRDSVYKLIHFAAEDRFELYHLPTDPLELDNVFAHQGHLRTQWQIDLQSLARERAQRDAPGADDVLREDVARRIEALGY